MGEGRGRTKHTVARHRRHRTGGAGQDGSRPPGRCRPRRAARVARSPRQRHAHGRRDRRLDQPRGVLPVRRDQFGQLCPQAVPLHRDGARLRQSPAWPCTVPGTTPRHTAAGPRPIRPGRWTPAAGTSTRATTRPGPWTAPAWPPSPRRRRRSATSPRSATTLDQRVRPPCTSTRVTATSSTRRDPHRNRPREAGVVPVRGRTRRGAEVGPGSSPALPGLWAPVGRRRWLGREAARVHAAIHLTHTRSVDRF